MIPPTYLEELSLLQDRIAPFSTEIAFNMIEKELGLPIDILFSEITPEPVAAASLGQVCNIHICNAKKRKNPTQITVSPPICRFIRPGFVRVEKLLLSKFRGLEFEQQFHWISLSYGLLLGW